MAEICLQQRWDSNSEWPGRQPACGFVFPNTVINGDKGYRVMAIGDCAFRGCSSLTSVSIPGSVTKIGIRVFNNCTALKTVSLADGIAGIGDYAFCGHSSLSSISIPGSVTNIDLVLSLIVINRHRFRFRKVSRASAIMLLIIVSH